LEEKQNRRDRQTGSTLTPTMMPAPTNEGSALVTLTVSAVLSLERQAVPLVIKMTVEAVLV
jgi:hypothetical protein